MMEMIPRGESLVRQVFSDMSVRFLNGADIVYKKKHIHQFFAVEDRYRAEKVLLAVNDNQDIDFVSLM